jgi:hypothetical protein
MCEKGKRFWIDGDHDVLVGSGFCQSFRHLQERWSAISSNPWREVCRRERSRMSLPRSNWMRCGSRSRVSTRSSHRGAARGSGTSVPAGKWCSSWHVDFGVMEGETWEMGRSQAVRIIRSGKDLCRGYGSEAASQNRDGHWWCTMGVEGWVRLWPWGRERQYLSSGACFTSGKMWGRHAGVNATAQRTAACAST